MIVKLEVIPELKTYGISSQGEVRGAEADRIKRDVETDAHSSRSRHIPAGWIIEAQISLPAPMRIYAYRQNVLKSGRNQSQLDHDQEFCRGCLHYVNVKSGQMGAIFYEIMFLIQLGM